VPQLADAQFRVGPGRVQLESPAGHVLAGPHPPFDSAGPVGTGVPGATGSRPGIANTVRRTWS
jgi:hypothetical protein